MKLDARFGYLLGMDLVHLAKPLPKGESIFDEYNAREPGYLRQWLRAYQYALVQTAFSADVTPDLLLGIQTIASGHYPAEESITGYAEHYESYLTMPMDGAVGQIPNYSCTQQGIKDFIETWFVTANDQLHSLYFASGNCEDKILMKVVDYDAKTQFFTIAHSQNKAEKIPKQGLFDFIESIFGCGLVKVERKQLSKIDISRQLQKLCVPFNKNVKTAQTQEQKKSLIVEFVMRVNQLHPFSDCNTRTCYIMMNVLFRRYQLPCALLINPNRIDLCTVDDVVRMVDKGVKYFRQFATAACAAKSPLAICFVDGSQVGASPPSMTARAIEYVEKELAAQAMCHLFCAGEDVKSIAGISKKVSGPIGERKYGLALRRACVAKDVSWALRIIDQYARVIDFSEATSDGRTVIDLVNANKKLTGVAKDYLLSVLRQAGQCAVDYQAKVAVHVKNTQRLQQGAEKSSGGCVKLTGAAKEPGGAKGDCQSRAGVGTSAN